MRKQLPKTLIISIILVAALWLRLNNIGKFGFWFDEYFHVFAAKSLITEGSLYVPFYGNYTRAKPVTYITAASFKIFGESEASARVPFALINVVFIIIGYMILRQLLSERIAFVFAFVMSFSPFAIGMARECRMYTAFQLLYFTMSVTFLLGYESNSGSSKLRVPRFAAAFESKYGLNLSLLLLSVLMLLASASLHDLSYNFSLVVIGYCIILLLSEMFLGGLRKACTSKYAIFLLMIAFGALIILITKRGFVLSMFQIATYIPGWAWYSAEDYSHYRWPLQLDYPSLFFLYPVGVFCLVKSYGKKGLFFALSFVILILCHSFLFGRKHTRYIFYIFPYFIIGAAAAFESLVLPFLRSLSTQIESKYKWERGLFIVLAIPVVFFFLYPWFSDSRFVSRSPKRPDWKSLRAEIQQDIGGAAIVTTDPRAVKYYLKRDPDYLLIAKDDRASNFDYGNKLIDSFGELKEMIDATPKLLIIAERFRFLNKAFLNDSMRDYISKHMERLEGTFDRRILVFEKGF